MDDNDQSVSRKRAFIEAIEHTPDRIKDKGRSLCHSLPKNPRIDPIPCTRRILEDSKKSPLCDICESVDYESMLQIASEDFPNEGIQAISWKIPHDKFLGRKCPSCQLFASVCNNYAPRYRQQLRGFRRLPRPPRGKNTHPDEVAAPLSSTLFFVAIRDNKRIRSYYNIRNEIGARGLIVPLNTVLDGIQPVHVLNIKSVDFTLLSSYFEECVTNHLPCNQTSRQCPRLPHLRLIDCIQEVIVEKINFAEIYFTLSYVWGSRGLQPSDESLRDLDDDGRSLILKYAPLTIKDAMTTVKRLGHRYLWVDKYCINQSDTVEKALTIKNMDIIYEQSEATIVTMAGWNEDTGLPGVSIVPRRQLYYPQLSSVKNNRLFISTLPSIASLITDSLWNTRGWTYQEARLSRRCLFFTEAQVYFVCRYGTRSETVRGDPESCSVAKIMNSACLSPSLFYDQSPIEDGMFRDRFVFSQRYLTDQSDALNAFRGILSRSPWITLWGVPVIPQTSSNVDPCIGFVLGPAVDTPPKLA